MKRFVAIVIVLIAVLTVAEVALNRTDARRGLHRRSPARRRAADALARGEYLTKAADCVACHTVPESGKPFAGGVAFKLPIGTIYSSNITADPVNGIGGWSDDEFVRAVRDGIGKNGEHLYPAFPYTSYTKLSRDDVLAIKAYLLSLPPVGQANRANDLAFPFNQRWAIGFWNAAFFKDRRFVADAAKPPNGIAGRISRLRWAIARSAIRRAMWHSASSMARSCPAKNCRVGVPTTSRRSPSTESAHGAMRRLRSI